MTIITLLITAKKPFDENTVTPGVVGFFITFAVAVLTVVLLVDMTRRIRRTRYRGEIREQLQREAAQGKAPQGEAAQGKREP